MNTIKVNFSRNFNLNHRKENHFQQQYTGLVLDGNELREAVTLRIYGTSAVNYAALWYNNGKKWARGTGKAGGYGYHRPSAAAAEAFEAAGVELESDISGSGSAAIESAVKSLLCELYPERLTFVTIAHP